jgi:hypothetical protein
MNFRDKTPECVTPWKLLMPLELYSSPMGYTVAITAEQRSEIYWTLVSTGTQVLVAAKSECRQGSFRSKRSLLLLNA